MKKMLIAIASVFALSVTATSWAGEREEVEQTFAKWRSALETGAPENVVKLYQPDAILLATLSPKPITTQEGRIEYFSKLTAKPKLSASVDEEHIKLLDEDNAVVSGLYTFRFEQDGKKVEIPARYSFVYEKVKNDWMIVEHHSSKLPEKQ